MTEEKRFLLKEKGIKKDKKIHNKNYYLLKKGERKNAYLCGSEGYKRKGDFLNDENERERLQLAIDGELENVVEENKKKRFDSSEKDIEISDKKEKNIETKNKQLEKKENLTVIDKYVLTDKEFKSLPISTRTLRALEENGFVVMTNIQAVAIPIVLLNKHIYAQAQTGTGKTLCFGIPLVEKLYRNGVDNKNHILEGLIISPTRELVFQIFEVLNMLNKYHKLNICCVIGGKNEEREKGIFSYANIIVCTPGRLLFHLENNYFCNLDYVNTLVIDEIDKLVDSSFYSSLQNILLYKPRENCQICLFSATMCKYLNVILKTFHVKNYEYVSINDKHTYIENSKIKHIFIECSLYEKINYLYTFLFSKREKKIMVFFSTCKQVRFMFEIFKKVKVGVMKFLQLHGKMKQVSRLNTYSFFGKKKNFTCLFTTDIGCRGLDFLNVDWVIHFDVPENIETFIHRSGRTGRLNKEGNSLIFLASETDNRNIFLKILKDNNIEIKEKKISPNRLFDINNKIHSINAAFTDIKHLAKTALVNYLRHLMIVMKYKNINQLDLDKLADAYGLAQFSPEMKNELKITGKENPTNRTKPSRLQKFLEILKTKKKEKQNEQKKEMKDQANESQRESDMEKQKNKKDENINCKGKEFLQQKGDVKSDVKGDVKGDEQDEKSKKKDVLLRQNENGTLDADDDAFFQKRRVEIQGESLALMPKKKKKRVKVAGVLSNSVLYDDKGNEVAAETQKIKFLIGVQNGEEQRETEEMLEDNNYLNSLKEEIVETNIRMKQEKNADILHISDHDNTDEEYFKEETEEEEEEAEEEKEKETEEETEEDEEIETRSKMLKRKALKKMKRRVQKKKKAEKKNETKEENADIFKNVDITELENEALAYLQ